MSKFNFKRFSAKDKETIEYLRSIDGSSIYTYTFPVLFSWQNDEDYSFAVTGEAFIVKNGARGNNSYLFPRGKKEDKIKIIEALISEENAEFSFMGDGDKAFCEKYFPGVFLFSEARNDFSYIYDREEQVQLRGKVFKSLRHTVNHGKEAYSWEIENMTAENAEKAMMINEAWEKAHGVEKTDFNAAQTALRNFGLLGLWGLLFKADGEYAGYVAGSFVKKNIFDVNFSKILTPGVDCYIKWEMYNRLPREVKLIDSEEDMGIPGLRQHKLLRSPKTLSRVWKGKLKSENI